MMGHEPVRRKPVDPNSQIYSQQQHSRTRTVSSNAFPTQQYPQHPHYQQQHHAPTMHLQQPQPIPGHTRRSPSVNTFSTVSSNPPPAAFRTSPSIDLRRSTSSRSGGGAPNSYVALMRKQKATVWSDRAQTEDPRLMAQQKAAKERAAREVIGRGAATGRTATGLSSGKVVGKIRHGKPGVTGYMAPQNYLGVNSVPLRLSATEVEGEDSDEDDLSIRRLHHRRTGSSGRSSTASGGRRTATYRTSGAYSATHGGSGAKKWSPGDTPERAGSFATGGTDESANFKPVAPTRTTSTLSGSSAEKADGVPDLAKTSQAAKLASNSLLNAALTREKSVKNPEELRRRGSVDERTATLTRGRLFIANPD